MYSHVNTYHFVALEITRQYHEMIHSEAWSLQNILKLQSIDEYMSKARFSTEHCEEHV